MAVLASFACIGCKVVKVEDDRARKMASSGGEAVSRYSADFWRSDILPHLEERTIPLERLLTAMQSDFAPFADDHAHRTGEGSPWTFLVTGEAIITDIDRRSRRGSMDLQLDAANSESSILMQTGPVVSGTAIRDALPSISFNSFSDQLQYAEVGNALTRHALEGVAATLNSARAGDRVRFLAAVPVRSPDAPLVLTPIRVEVAQ